VEQVKTLKGKSEERTTTFTKQLYIAGRAVRNISEKTMGISGKGLPQ